MIGYRYGPPWTAINNGLSGERFMEKSILLGGKTKH